MHATLPPTEPMSRLHAALVLPPRFLRAMLVSGTQTLLIILTYGLRRRALPPSGLRRLAYAPMRPQGVALLAAMVSLTPGTTVIDIDAERHEFLVHMLDTRDAEAAAAEIRRIFQQPLCALFGACR
ncbi:multicomponent K+:H+ antiporter subunit E [Tibeticola sediminis]|uniref:Multicomponent K+:H+ antiporter subunit E n=2 Tax=Tibeticola sediminis TaxID=1917811 RepID=A0A3N4UZD4_9BURK|nr:multicomponent K+:H+ antiporter subunit E [Tibeticola sediminis]